MFVIIRSLDCAMCSVGLILISDRVNDLLPQYSTVGYLRVLQQCFGSVFVDTNQGAGIISVFTNPDSGCL